MYLTKDEFIILSGLKQGYKLFQIGQEYNISIGMNDPRIVSLCKKYGVDNYNIKALIQKADLNKAVVINNRNEIPYFQYNGYELVETVKICKKDIKELVVFFNNFVKDDDKYYDIITYYDGLCSYIKLIDKENNKEYSIRTVIDGEEENGSENNWK